MSRSTACYIILLYLMNHYLDTCSNYLLQQSLLPPSSHHTSRDSLSHHYALVPHALNQSSSHTSRRRSSQFQLVKQYDTASHYIIPLGLTIRSLASAFRHTLRQSPLSYDFVIRYDTAHRIILPHDEASPQIPSRKSPFQQQTQHYEHSAVTKNICIS